MFCLGTSLSILHRVNCILKRKHELRVYIYKQTDKFYGRIQHMLTITQYKDVTYASVTVYNFPDSCFVSRDNQGASENALCVRQVIILRTLFMCSCSMNSEG